MCVKRWMIVLLAALIMISILPASALAVTVKSTKSYPYAIEPQFVSAGEFHDGLASVKTVDDEIWFIDRNGKFVFSGDTYGIRFLPRFSDGLLPVYSGEGKCGYLNTEGKLVIGWLDYERCSEFNEGRAFLEADSRQQAIIDQQGNIIYKIPEHTSVLPFKNGMAIVCAGEYYFEQKCGYMNLEGKIVTPLEAHSSSIEDFREGFGAAGSHYYDQTGRLAFSFPLASGSSFYEGVAKVYTRQGFILIDRNGKQISSKAYWLMGDASNGMVEVFNSDRLGGYLDLTGREVIPLQYHGSGGNFHNGVARVVTNMDHYGGFTSYAYINKQGEELARFSPAGYDHLSFSSHPYLVIGRKDRQDHLIGLNGKVTSTYDSISRFIDGLAKVTHNIDDSRRVQVYGLIDEAGNDIVPAIYRNMSWMDDIGFSEDLLAVQDFETGYWGYIANPIVTAKRTASKVLVDGEEVAFQAYNIYDNNYFKLRDLAMVLNGTDKQFSVDWDGENNAITIVAGEHYSPVGGELEASEGAGSVGGKYSTSTIYLNGTEVSLTAYTIGGNNYLKLRDVAQALDFGVGWDGKANTVLIDSRHDYVAE